MPQLDLGNIRVIFPNFQNFACCEKYLRDNKHDSLHLTRKYAQTFVRGNYLFLKAQSFPRATLLENCSLLGTENVRGRKSEHIFALNGGFCLYICCGLSNCNKKKQNGALHCFLHLFFVSCFQINYVCLFHIIHSHQIFSSELPKGIITPGFAGVDNHDP